MRRGFNPGASWRFQREGPSLVLSIFDLLDSVPARGISFLELANLDRKILIFNVMSPIWRFKLENEKVFLLGPIGKGSAQLISLDQKEKKKKKKKKKLNFNSNRGIDLCLHDVLTLTHQLIAERNRPLSHSTTFRARFFQPIRGQIKRL